MSDHEHLDIRQVIAVDEQRLGVAVHIAGEQHIERSGGTENGQPLLVRAAFAKRRIDRQRSFAEGKPLRFGNGKNMDAVLCGKL